MDGDPLLWSIDETAIQLAVSSKTVSRLLGSGQLPKVQIGKSVRVSPRAVQEFVENQTIPAQNKGCVGSVMRKGENVCHINAKTVPSGGYRTPTQTAKELENLLGQQTARKQKH